MQDINSGNSMPEMPRKKSSKRELSSEEMKQYEKYLTDNSERVQEKQTQEPHKAPNTQPHKKKKTKDYTTQNIILCVLALIGEIGIVITMLNTTQFSSVSKG